MATIGQQLTTPEAGWKRYDDRDTNISYTSGFVKGKNSSDYNSTWTQVTANTKPEYARFNFIGTKIRFISIANPGYPQYAYIKIDGIEYSFSINPGNGLRALLLFEKTDLLLTEHYVEIFQKDNSNFGLVVDAIDIDDTGALKPYMPPSITAPTNLIATAGDSQVTLSWDAIAGASGYNVKRATNAGGPYITIATNVTDIDYIDNTVTNGTTYYFVVTAVNESGIESANSNEASATPQALSGYGLLRVTMNDSSEREYQLSTTEIDGFINWVKDHVSTDPNCYMLNKIEVLQNSKEYLMFEKIISFEIMELTK